MIEGGVEGTSPDISSVGSVGQKAEAPVPQPPVSPEIGNLEATVEKLRDKTAGKNTNTVDDQAGEGTQTEKGKDEEAKNATNAQAEQTGTPEQRLQIIEQEVKFLVLENKQLREQLATIGSSIAEILPAIKILLENAEAAEKDPKKKETLLGLIAKIIGIMALSFFTVAGKEVTKQ